MLADRRRRKPPLPSKASSLTDDACYGRNGKTSQQKESKMKTYQNQVAKVQDKADDVFWIGYEDAINGHPVYYCSSPMTVIKLLTFIEAYDEGYAAGLNHTH